MSEAQDGVPTKSLNPARLVNTDKLKGEIAARLSVSEVAEQLCDVELMDAGHQKKGLCPVHAEDTPSFHVNDGKGVFHCFACKAGGDSISLVQQVRHVGFRDALVMLAQAAGIDISAYERPPTDEERETDALRAWAEGWIESLPQHKGRVKPSDLARVPKKPVKSVFGEIPKALRDKDYLLRGEVLFPYRAPNGRLVGWKVRAKDKAMFMTPNDFPLTETTLFGIHEARAHITDRLIVVEGEFDRQAMVDHGFAETVAMGGSKWTDEHMRIVEDLKVREVLFLMDGDEGGRSAAESIAKRYWKHDITVKIARAWEGADPEDMLNTMGPDFITGLDAKGALEWLLWQEWVVRPRPTLTDKLEFVRWIQSEYGEQLVGVQETLVLQEVATWMGISEVDVLDFARATSTLLQVPESEKVVLGRAIRDGKYYIDVRKRIARDDFFVMKHQRLWTILEQMVVEGLEFDLATVKRRAAGEGIEDDYLSALALTGEQNLSYHEQQVIDFSVRRSVRADADYFRELIGDTSVPANQLIGTLTHRVTSKALGRGSGAFRGIHDQVDEAMERLYEQMRNPSAVRGIHLGSQFPGLTKNMQGLQQRRLVLVAATSGKGKSTITLEWATALAVHQAVPTDYVSLEMDSDEILYKQVSHLTSIDSMKISGGDLTEDELRQVEQAMMRIRNSPLRIYAPDGITPNEFLLYCRESKMDRRTEVFFLDYIQMVGPDPETMRASRYEQLGQMAYLAKQKVARGLDTTVVCCAQLKRDAAGKEEPTPEDMGDSYEMVRAADVILLLNEDDNKQHELWIGKNRQGPGGLLIPVMYDKPTNTFHESSGGAKVPDYAVL